MLIAGADFIDTPLPGVSEEARKDPKGKWPHQDDKERREDLDVPDEGEGITKVPGFNPQTNPTATPDLGKYVFRPCPPLQHTVSAKHYGVEGTSS